MSGISSALYSQLRTTLMDCGPFESNEQLKSVFAHPNLKPWRNSVPEAPTRTDRVDRTIYELVERRNMAGENALVLFLRASSEKRDSDSECHHRLASLTENLEQALGEDALASTTGPASLQSSLIDGEIVAEIERLVREDMLAEALEKLSSLEVHRQEATLLARRLKRVRDRERQGTITHNGADAEYTKIAKAILDLFSM